MSAKRDIRYWTGVLNTVKLINRFLAWKSKNPHEDQTLKELLIVMQQKAEKKIGVEEDLADELGVGYLREPSEPTIQKPIFEPVYQRESVKPEPTVPVQVVSEPTTPKPTFSSEPTTPEPVVSEPAIPEPVVSEPAIPEPVVSEPAIPESSLPPERVVSAPPITEPSFSSSDLSFPPPTLDSLPSSAQMVPEPSPSTESEPELSPELIEALGDETPLPPSPTPSAPTTVEEEDEDLLSSSLRAALKMLRQPEDED
ncbi:MAG: hypothetical protein ACFFCQ_05405 [Promethearchaeota archaeon]